MSIFQKEGRLDHHLEGKMTFDEVKRLLKLEAFLGDG